MPTNITANKFAETSEFAIFFSDKKFHLDQAKHWSGANLLQAPKHDNPKIFEITTPVTNKMKPGNIIPDNGIIACVRTLTHRNNRLHKLIAASKHPISPRLKEAMKHFNVKDSIMYNENCIEVLNNDIFQAHVLNIRHRKSLEGQPGKSKTLALVRCSFTWPSMTAHKNRYIYGCVSCQQVKDKTQKPFGTLKPLPILAGTWKDISYKLITRFLLSNRCNIVLTVVDCLKMMAHFEACTKTKRSKHLANLMLQNVWKIHGTPKTTVSPREVFSSPNSQGSYINTSESN